MRAQLAALQEGDVTRATTFGLWRAPGGREATDALLRREPFSRLLGHSQVINSQIQPDSCTIPRHQPTRYALFCDITPMTPAGRAEHGSPAFHQAPPAGKHIDHHLHSKQVNTISFLI